MEGEEDSRNDGQEGCSGVGRGRRDGSVGDGLALMTESDKEKMMRIYEAAMPEELKKMNIVAGKATIEKMVQQRAENEKKKRKIRLIDQGVQRKNCRKGAAREKH